MLLETSLKLWDLKVEHLNCLAMRPQAASTVGYQQTNINLKSKIQGLKRQLSV